MKLASPYRTSSVRPHPSGWEAEWRTKQALTEEALALAIGALADMREQVPDDIAALERRLTEKLETGLTSLARILLERMELNHADLRQIGHLAARRTEHDSPRIRCLFLVHAIESWDAQIDIFEAMQADPRFDPLVASIARKFPGDADYGREDETSAALDRAGVPHIRLGMADERAALDIIRAVNPDVIFRQSQWEADVPPAFRTEKLNFARICSVPYGMSIVGKFMVGSAGAGDVDPQSFDQPYHRAAWRIFCETEQTRAYFAQFRHSDPAKLILSGYPKLNRLLRARTEPESWPILERNGRAFRIIWAPHYSVGTNWLGFGTFDRVYLDFLAFAQSRPDLDFVLKPHPSLFQFVVSNGIISQGNLDDFLAQWRALPNCAVDLGTYAHLFAASDMMVTDGLSFLTEYPLFEKPLLFIDSRRHVPMNALGTAALDCAVHATDFEMVREAMLAFASGAPWQLEAERQRLRTMLLPAADAPVDIILSSIAEGFASEERQAA